MKFEVAVRRLEQFLFWFALTRMSRLSLLPDERVQASAQERATCSIHAGEAAILRYGQF
ncbi:hypothetical protein KOR42_25240 [Thalassoglobus neptunius]|uniref:Uncharacterized protein n=1 Tax=Thalassoglobus neptunius TaxID=1938619 RepID=A0A5C5XAD1_9PLAN|nr:hypothetical protein KOR42_25240 [Thalassoglobus neptunius]